MTTRKCECCGEEAKYSIEVAIGPNVNPDEDRLYLPNQSYREHKSTDKYLWFCHPCMRFVEDNFRACVAYLKKERGLMFRK